jgi:hypothetical protein
LPFRPEKALRPRKYEIRSPAIPPAIAAMANATRLGRPVADNAPRPITTVSDGTIGRKPSSVTAAKTIT